MPKQPELVIDLDEFNQSELVALAQWCGINASRAWPRDMVVEALETFDHPDASNPLDRYRTKMHNWLNKYWDRVKMQAVKKACPNCHSCRDMQALQCFIINRKYIER